MWVSGVRAGAHTGGYTGFSFDINGLLRAGGNEVVVGAFDPSDATGIPVGKQSRNPGGVYYTAASGIWQTVWLEPVAEAHVSTLDITHLDPAVGGVQRELGGTTRRGWPGWRVTGNSGSPCCGGNLVDDHIYVGPGERVRAANLALLSENRCSARWTCRWERCSCR
ncbi:hypothetical protein M8C13_21800 [Crossiella sp. SN42]|nr:hypothetical protein [Crossiella sp. SN42]